MRPVTLEDALAEPLAGDDAAGECVLCPPLRFRFNEMAGLPGADAVLDADGDFLLTPDVAPLLDGHVLLVTARHHQSAGTFSPRLWTRARAWRERVARLYRAAYGSGELVVFEHGPGRSQGGGACIDHAHWHFLPGRLAIRQVVEDRGLPGKPAGHGAVRDRVLSGRSYLLLDQDDCLTVHPGDTVPSQFLRWAVLAALDATAQPPRDGFVHPAAPGTGPRNDDERTNRPGNEAGQERPVWRWQELFGLPDSRARFLRTLAALRSAVDEVQRDDSHQ
ncbi:MULTISPECIES: hypothetical protein [Actinomadura]|uniref:HIT domain-containing protein n=1 Tax=Actinomadura yumaensis TaxID=111807 RepID=A0ABW2CQ67_9ACTN|nr:hypothetical protein [Actinomadura sp. J1-007]MWK39061.1 hypothetical protein [Actinomadura sp. J1-007]